MPVWFEEKRISFSSAENDAPLTATVFMNCSMLYCFDGRCFLPSAAKSAAGTKRSARVTRASLRFIVQSLSMLWRGVYRRLGKGRSPDCRTLGRFLGCYVAGCLAGRDLKR